MADFFDLTGRQALVTGASRGIGLALAQAFAERGAEVALTGRKQEALDAAADSMRQPGRRVLPVVCNQGQPADIERLFDDLERAAFHADVVVINAATNPVMTSLVDTDEAAWRKILDVNLTGAWLTARRAARGMLARDGGTLIFMTSVAGLDPWPGLGAYSVSKTGVIGLARALAGELAPRVRVNAVAPGLIETQFSAALFQDRAAYQRFLERVPLGRHGQPEDVVGTVLYLASAASAYVTGQVLVVDGGGH